MKYLTWARRLFSALFAPSEAELIPIHKAVELALIVLYDKNWATVSGYLGDTPEERGLIFARSIATSMLTFARRMALEPYEIVSEVDFMSGRLENKGCELWYHSSDGPKWVDLSVRKADLQKFLNKDWPIIEEHKNDDDIVDFNGPSFNMGLVKAELAPAPTVAPKGRKSRASRMVGLYLPLYDFRALSDGINLALKRSPKSPKLMRLRKRLASEIKNQDPKAQG
mgnify:FL=1